MSPAAYAAMVFLLGVILGAAGMWRKVQRANANASEACRGKKLAEKRLSQCNQMNARLRTAAKVKEQP